MEEGVGRCWRAVSEHAARVSSSNAVSNLFIPWQGRRVETGSKAVGGYLRCYPSPQVRRVAASRCSARRLVTAVPVFRRQPSKGNGEEDPKLEGKKEEEGGEEERDRERKGKRREEEKVGKHGVH